MSKLNKSILSLWSEPYIRFIIWFIALFFILYGFNIAFIGVTAKGGLYIPFLDEHLNYINWWRTFAIESTATVLRWFNYIVYTNDYQLRVIGRSGFTMVYSCLGYGVMSVFIAFVLTFPGKIKARYGFLFLGLVIIQLLNTIRLVLLSLYWNRRPKYLTIDHHDLFNIIVYAVLIILVYIWLKQVSKPSKT
ncbi:exosortase Y [Pedobacter xixiisoli]|uniref:Exosortase/archaeosortase family protein n=1 Tax=Pedobacter xixiisoli TaxID=1476464 RepID=A0A286A9K0_9SPHI|nr:archaeosortase/exosortase family protein [Pedobacter xixiisoli]SOD18594.1 exosortase/archaeosortase family protein [Pedobacter xixiisoli]